MLKSMYLLVVFVVLAFSCLVAKAQTAGEKPKLRLSIRQPPVSVCQGTTFPILVRLQNVGTRSVVVDLNRVGNVQSVTNQDGNGSLYLEEVADAATNLKILPPSSSVWQKVYLSLGDFESVDPGKNYLSVYYFEPNGLSFRNLITSRVNIRSEAVPFRVSDCGASQKELNEE